MRRKKEKCVREDKRSKQGKTDIERKKNTHTENRNTKTSPNHTLQNTGQKEVKIKVSSLTLQNKMIRLMNSVR